MPSPDDVAPADTGGGPVTVLRQAGASDPRALCPDGSSLTGALGLSQVLEPDVSAAGSVQCAFSSPGDVLDIVSVVLSYDFEVAKLAVTAQEYDGMAALTWPELAQDAWGYAHLSDDGRYFECELHVPGTDHKGDMGTLQLRAAGGPGASVQGPYESVEQADVDVVCGNLAAAAVLIAQPGEASPDEALAVQHAREDRGLEPANWEPDIVRCSSARHPPLPADQAAECAAAGYGGATS